MNDKESKSATGYGNYNSNLYGSTTAGGFTPTAFQKNLVSTAESQIPKYMEQLTNPTYDSEVFKAQTELRNNLANQSFENNLINPLASRGLTRGSSVAQMGSEFANTLANAETQAMANEDQRNQQMINSLLSAYQVPLSTMQAITPLGGQTSTQVNPDDTMGQLLGMGTQLGAAALMGSDKRLKENINKIGEVEGVNIYEFNYIDDIEKNRKVGVIAQELLGTENENAVLKNAIDGVYMAVDYSKLPINVQIRIGELL